VTPTLFGQWALVGEWGRIGQAGAVRENWIESESAASAAGTKPFTHWLRVYLCWRLFQRFPGDAREREPVKARLEAIALGMHAGESNAAATPNACRRDRLG
jgi:hypothetical protein